VTPPRLQKDRVFEALRATLRDELEAVGRGAAMARDEATSAESRPENQYDTRALEASYLAAGQGERLAAARALSGWAEVATARPTSRIEAGALARLDGPAGGQWVLFAPRGGLELAVDREKVTLISVSSPLGTALAGLGADDEVEVDSPTGVRRWSVDAVW
jgi:transcription elongation GreA/GreB family factor